MIAFKILNVYKTNTSISNSKKTTSTLHEEEEEIQGLCTYFLAFFLDLLRYLEYEIHVTGNGI
jgi:hypothetical protein